MCIRDTEIKPINFLQKFLHLHGETFSDLGFDCIEKFVDVCLLFTVKY